MDQSELYKLIKLFNVKFPNTVYSIKGYEGDRVLVEVFTQLESDNVEIYEELMENFDSALEISELVSFQKKYIGKYEGVPQQLIGQILEDFDSDRVRIIVERL